MGRSRAGACMLALCHGLLATGCAQVLGIDSDYGDQADGGALPAANGDAGAPDGSLDARVHDATAVRDARAEQDAARGGETDAAVKPADASTIEAGLSSFCASAGAHLVCDDFDQTPQNWSEQTIAGSQQIDTVSATSPPNAYAASTNELAAGMAKAARSLTFPTPPSAYHFEYSLRVDARDTTSATALAAVTMKDAQTGSYYSGGIVLLGTGAVFEDVWVRSSGASESHERHPLARDIASGKWVRVVADVAFAASGATLSLKLDGVRLFERLALQPTTVTGQTSVTIGITYLAGPAPPWRVRYDDVVFDMN